MRYTAPRHSVILQRAALGPAAVAARAQMIRHINLGLPQRAFVSADMMRRGGSLGGMGCCGLGALAVPPSVTIGPIAAQLINLRKSGVTPQAALVTVLAQLAAKGESVVTPAIHLQLAAGLQPMPSGLHGFLGALGLAPVGAAGMTGSTLAASTAGAGALATGATSIGLATGVGSLGAGIALGQTVIPFPVVGAVIGAVVFEAMHLLKRHVGKAEAAWANQGFYNSLRSMNGRDYDEHQYSEAFKGMMDTGNNIMPGCGPDRHKNPDCFMGPLAGVIAQGYLSGTVPLSATTSQVFQTVVIPWLKSGSGGLVNWGNLSREPIQQLMIQAATDRYLADQPMTRGDMDSYGHVGAHTPTLVQALQPILRQPTTTTPNVTSAPAPAPPSIMQPGMVTPDIPVGGGGPAAYAPNPVYTGGGGQALPQYPPYVPGSAVNNGQPLLPSPPGSLMTPAKPGGLAALIPWGLVIAAGAAILS